MQGLDWLIIGSGAGGGRRLRTWLRCDLYCYRCAPRSTCRSGTVHQAVKCTGFLARPASSHHRALAAADKISTAPQRSARLCEELAREAQEVINSRNFMLRSAMALLYVTWAIMVWIIFVYGALPKTPHGGLCS